MSLPVVGICASVEEVRWGVWELHSNLTPRAYTDAVQEAGGLAMVLPPDDSVAEAPDQVLSLIDALVLAGGADVDPASYGARPRPETHGSNPGRDRFELALTHGAMQRDLPVLGICRGMQLLNVSRGGTLDQHLTRLDLHAHTPGAFSDHEVRLEPGSLAARTVGGERTIVKSHHHQGIEELGEGLVATGWSLPDGVVEALEAPGRRFALGVLWHPEEDERSRVISGVVAAARG